MIKNSLIHKKQNFETGLRKQFASTMIDIGKIDKRLIVIVADISHGILQPFNKMFPGRYYNIGICEPSIVNMCAGLSKMGFIPVVHTITPFLIERSLEQIKLDFSYQKLPLNLISVGGTYDYSKLGCSHHSYSDLASLKHFENINLFVPGSSKELHYQFINNYNRSQINYFRLTEYPHNYNFQYTKLIKEQPIQVEKGKNLTICVLGNKLKSCLELTSKLKKYKVTSDLFYINKLKPINLKKIKDSVDCTKKLIVIEEVSSYGGLYEDCLKIIHGINDLNTLHISVNSFIRDYGSYDDLTEISGLSTKKILKKVLKFLNLN